MKKTLVQITKRPKTAAFQASPTFSSRFSMYERVSYVATFVPSCCIEAGVYAKIFVPNQE